MDSFVSGQLVVDSLERPYVYLDKQLGSTTCVVYNPRTYTFEIKNVTDLRSAHSDANKHYVVNIYKGLHSINSGYNHLIGQLYPKALKQAIMEIRRFKKLVEYTLDLSDSTLLVESVELSNDISHDWKDLILIGGTRTRNSVSQHFIASLNALKPNNRTIQHMVETNALP